MSLDKLYIKDELTNVIENLIKATAKELDLGNAPVSADDKYTVFTALGCERDEDRTHIAFLQEMLDGNHDLKTQFLRKFLEMVLHEEYQIGTKVFRECHIPKTRRNYGRMDLYIESGDACYPIEVKIFAKDQDRQIERYYRFAKAKRAYFKVFYLTLNGRKPSDRSMGSLKTNDKSVTCISFAENIYAWLIECAEIASEKKLFGVEKAINQYKTLIEKLTGAEQEDESMDVIRKIITSSRDNYLSATKIAQNMNRVRIEKLQQLLNDLHEHIKDKWHLAGDMEEQKNIENYYTCDEKNQGEGPGISFVIKELEKDKLTVYFRIEVDGDLEYGVQFRGFSREWCPEKYKKLRYAFHEDWQKIIDNHEDKENCWLWWNDLRGILDADFIGCCNDDYVQLFDPEMYKTKLKMIKDVIDENMQNIITNGVPNEPPLHLI